MSRWWLLLGLAAPVLAETLVMQAPLEAATSATVFAPRTGTVQRVRVRVGDWTGVGDTLAALDDALLRLAEEEAQLVWRQAQQRWARAQVLHARGGISTQDLEGLALAARKAALALQQVQRERAQTILTSPLAGVVAEQHLEPGARVAAGTRCFRIIDPTHLQAELFVPVEWLEQVAVGQRVTARVPATAKILPGRVTRISPVADAASGRIRVEARFPNAGRVVRPGVVVRVCLSPEPSRDKSIPSEEGDHE